MKITAKAKTNIGISFLIAILGIVYIYPVGVDHVVRLSIGGIVLVVCSYVFLDSDALLLGMLSGILLIAFRVAADVFYGADLLSAALYNLPTYAFYICFGFFLKLIYNRFKRPEPLKLSVLLFFAEIISNLFEYLIRGTVSIDIFVLISFSAAIRTFIAIAVLSVIRYQRIYSEHMENLKYYSNLTTIVSDIYAEMFYLKKSSHDIENVMRKSYDLYGQLENGGILKTEALDISKDIHEIRKDYYRVIKGFDKLLEETALDETMSLKQIFEIIKSNSDRVYAFSQRKIHLIFEIDADIKVKKIYDIFVIVNNLISNAFDAVSEGDTIKVTAKLDAQNLLLNVLDNGAPIPDDIKDYIFNPGFTTKYDDITGEPSTGIGLCHIENIVKTNGGKIDLKSSFSATSFLVTLPICKIT